MQKIGYFFVLLGALVSSPANAIEAPAQYASSCTFCHAAGAAGAPRTGDAAAWAPLLAEKGMDGLVLSVTNGLGAMPPRGMCNNCSAEDYQALIEYMAGDAAKGN